VDVDGEDILFPIWEKEPKQTRSHVTIRVNTRQHGPVDPFSRTTPSSILLRIALIKMKHVTNGGVKFDKVVPTSKGGSIDGRERKKKKFLRHNRKLELRCQKGVKLMLGELS